MSFGKKYFSSYKSNNGLDYYLELFVANFSGTATEIVLGKGGPVINYETDQEDRFSPILSSQCDLPFLVQNTTDQTFIEELRTTFQERQIYLHLYRASSSTYSTVKPLWSGFMVMDLGAGEDVSFPYEQKLTFVDGLALLKDIDFVDLSQSGFENKVMGNYAKQNMYFGPANYTFWIKEILLKAGCATTSEGSTQDYGFTTAINWYNGAMPNTNQNFDPFGNTKCVVSMFHTKNDQQVFTPQNCYTVLKELLRHWGARITYWKHEFWIVQIPEYIQDETGFIDNPDNINTRQYNKSGTLLSSQDHLGDTFFTRYEQTVGPNQISKLIGTKYNYLPITHRVSADFLSFASKNYYGGFPFGTNATSQEIFQGTIIDPSSANFLFLSIPLNWVWDLSNSNIVEHTGGWWCSIKFNFYATDGTTEYYLQYEQTSGTYYWVLEADWSPIVKSPKYVIKSRSNIETNYVGFQEQIPFVDVNGNAIQMNGAWSFFLDIENYATQDGGSFFCRFSNYNNFSGTVIQRNPQVSILLPNPSGSGTTSSGTVSWSNTLQDPSQILVPSTNVPVTFNAGTSQQDIQLLTNSPFMGFLQTLNTTQNASYGNQIFTTVNNSNNTELHNFGTLIWGDAVLQSTIGALRVNNGSTFIKTNPDGEWGRGILSGTKTFTELLIDEFLSGQVKVVISPTMRLVVSESLKNQTSTASGGGTAERPRYVNPIGRLRETRSNETDPEYIFRRGSFFTLQDEWDYEGYQILRDTVTTTTSTNDLGGLGGSQTDAPLDNARMQGPVADALMMNAPVAYIRQTVASTGPDVALNGNFTTTSNWTLGTGWAIDTTAKKAKFNATGSTSELTQSVLTEELTYEISFRVEVTAGTLLAKAGGTGQTQTITASGDYSIYLQCFGTSLIKFQAGETFTGTITFITIEEQKFLTQVPIEPLNNAVFKTGDTFNLINSNSGEIMELNVTSNQSAGDTVINVTSTALTDDIGIGSIILINQDDLSAQYQNKTKGTVGGFDITATSIDSGSVAISSYIDDDSFGTASATSLATSESIKAYVDGQTPATPNLQQVTNAGNTTTNSIVIDGQVSAGTHFKLQSGGKLYSNASNVTLQSASGSYLGFNISTSEKMRLTSGGNLLLGTTTDDGSSKLQVNGNAKFTGNVLAQKYRLNDYSTYDILSNSGATIYLKAPTSQGDLVLQPGNSGETSIEYSSSALNSARDVLILNRTYAAANGSGTAYGVNLNVVFNESGGSKSYVGYFANYTETAFQGSTANLIQLQRDSVDRFLVDRNGNATFSGQVTIPATPVASTDAASKGYVDAQVGSADTLEEVTANGNSTSYGIEFTSTNFSIGESKIGLFSNNVIYLRGGSGGLVLSNGDGQQNLGFIGNYIRWETSNSEKMRLTSAGKLGLGVTNPDVQFHASGDVKFTNAFVLDSIKHSGDSDTKIGFDTDTIKFDTNSSERMRLTSTGRLGIGVTSPDQLIHAESSSDTAIKVKKTGGNFIQLTAGGAGGRITSDSQINFDAGGNTGAMLISSSGNVGIGTSSPSEKLHVVGDALITGDSHADAFKSAATGEPIKFKNFGSTELARITDGGNLLIGTTTDSGAKLNVQGSLQVGVDDTGYDVTFYGATSGRNLQWDESLDSLVFSADTRLRLGGSNSFWIDSDGTNSSITNRNTGGLDINNQVTGTELRLRAVDVGVTNFMTLGGSNATINVYKNLLIGTTTDSGGIMTISGNVNLIGSADKINFQGTSGGNNEGITYKDSGGSQRYGLLFAASNIVALTNRAADGKVQIRANNATAGGSGEVTVAEFEDTLIKLNQPVQVARVSTPSDPATNTGVIYLDENLDLKIKISGSAGVVTRTLAQYEL